MVVSVNELLVRKKHYICLLHYIVVNKAYTKAAVYIACVRSIHRSDVINRLTFHVSP